MSSRRSSAITTTADASLQNSRSGSPFASNDVQGGDTCMPDLTNMENEDENEEMKDGMISTQSYIQRSPQLDIAFLHSISTHRPLGPHKHFNVIPVLITLDRTIRQIGARMRDASTSESLEDIEEEKSDREEGSNKRKRNDRSPSTSKKIIKKEDGEDDILLDTASAAAMSAMQIDSDMVWQRLHELYDMEGLEELEDGAVDGEDDSPFYVSPRPTYFSIATRKVLGEKIKFEPAFGFGSSLIKLPESVIAAQLKSSGRQQKPTTSKASQNDGDEEDEEEEEEERIADFELGPWEEYEDLIAPRRLKTNAPEEDQSESDEDLSEPSEEAKPTSTEQGEEDSEAKEEEEEEEEDDDDGEEEEEEEEEDEGEGGDDEDDEEEDQEEEEENDEEEKPSRRKGASSSLSSKRPPVNSRRKSGTASATPAPATTSTRTSRSSAKPRRSARR